MRAHVGLLLEALVGKALPESQSTAVKQPSLLLLEKRWAWGNSQIQFTNLSILQFYGLCFSSVGHYLNLAGQVAIREE